MIRFDKCEGLCYDIPRNCTIVLNMNTEIIINELIRQNPWWIDPKVLAEDPTKPKRDVFQLLKGKVCGNDLITAITGLRRIGKTTIVKQIINDLLNSKTERRKILYFSFEEASLAKDPDLLEKIIDYQLKNNTDGKLFLFLDEIQYVDFWNAVLKKYVDSEPRLKFVVTGSSSLFLKTGARESLAGRILEIIMRPLSFGEYLRIVKGIELPVVAPFSVDKLILYERELKENFYNYLVFGEFPYLAKLDQFSDQKQYVLDWVIGKIVESDLLKIRRVVNTNALVNLTNVLLVGSGQLVELQNLARDLGLDRATLGEYLSLLEKTNLTGTVFNRGVGYRSRSLRQRKIYSASVNAIALKNTNGPFSESFKLKIGQVVECFVFNYLSSKEGELFFWRQRQIKEVDFIWQTPEKVLPVEVKFQSEIRPEDLKNLLYYCRKEKIQEAVVITQDQKEEKMFDDIKVKFSPGYYLV